MNQDIVSDQFRDICGSKEDSLVTLAMNHDIVSDQFGDVCGSKEDSLITLVMNQDGVSDQFGDVCCCCNSGQCGGQLGDDL